MTHLLSIPDEPAAIPIEKVELALRELGIVDRATSFDRIHSVVLEPESATVRYITIRHGGPIYIERTIPFSRSADA